MASILEEITKIVPTLSDNKTSTIDTSISGTGNNAPTLNSRQSQPSLNSISSGNAVERQAPTQNTQVKKTSIAGLGTVRIGTESEIKKQKEQESAAEALKKSIIEKTQKAKTAENQNKTGATEFFSYLDDIPDDIISDETFVKKASERIQGVTAEQLLNIKTQRKNAISQLSRLTPEQLSQMPEEAMAVYSKLGIDPSKHVKPKWVQDLSSLGKSFTSAAAKIGAATPAGQTGGIFTPYGKFKEAELKLSGELQKEMIKKAGTANKKNYQRFNYVDKKTDKTMVGVFDPDSASMYDASGKPLEGDIQAGSVVPKFMESPEGLISIYSQANGSFAPAAGFDVSKYTPKQQERIGKSLSVLYGSEVYKQARAKLIATSELKSLLSEGSIKGREGFIHRTLLRMSGEQRFTEADIQQMSGSRSLKDKAIQAYKTLKDGEISEGNIKIFLDALNVLQKSNSGVVKGEIENVLGDLSLTSSLSTEQINEIKQQKLDSEYKLVMNKAKEATKTRLIPEMIFKTKSGGWAYYAGGDKKDKSNFAFLGNSKSVSYKQAYDKLNKGIKSGKIKAKAEAPKQESNTMPSVNNETNSFFGLGE